MSQKDRTKKIKRNLKNKNEVSTVTVGAIFITILEGFSYGN